MSITAKRGSRSIRSYVVDGVRYTIFLRYLVRGGVRHTVVVSRATVATVATVEAGNGQN